MTLSTSSQILWLAPWGQESLREEFRKRFREAHSQRSLGFGIVETPTLLEAGSGVRVGWILRGEGRARSKGDTCALLPGDQITVSQNSPLDVEGSFAWAWIEDEAWNGVIPPAVQPLMSLPDTSGGCNVSPGAFRRLQITWNPKDVSKKNPDGSNRLNSHVVNIESRFSNTHYHPSPAEGGGDCQEELYFVLDPKPYSIPSSGIPAVLAKRSASIPSTASATSR